MELLTKAIPTALVLFVVSSMLAAGLSLSVREILAPLRNVRLVSLAVLANFFLMPLVAFGITRLLWLDRPLGAALLLLGAAAGSPIFPKLVAIAKGDRAFAVGLMVLLMVVTVVYMPLVIPSLLKSVSVRPLTIGRSLLLFMLLPLSAGLALKARFDLFAERARSFVNAISNLSLVLLFVLLLATNIRNVVNLFGTRGILAGILFILFGLAFGWFFGGSNLGTKASQALGTAQRNLGAAFVIAGEDFHDPKVMVMLSAVALIGLLILVPFARALAKQSSTHPAEPHSRKAAALHT